MNRNLNRKLKIALSSAGLGLFWAIGAAPVTAQDVSAGHNDHDVRKPEKPKKESRPNKDQNRDNGTIQTVLVFPPDTPSPPGIADQLTDTVTRVIQRRLSASNKYHSVYFTGGSASVRRAVSDGRLTAADTDRPFNPLKAKKISALTGYANVFMTDINGYSFDADKHQVTLSISLSLIDYSGSKPVVRSAGEQMESSAKASKNGTELTIAMDVARDLTEKLMTELFKPKPVTATPAATDDAGDKDKAAAPEKTDKTDKSDPTKTEPAKPDPAK